LADNENLRFTVIDSFSQSRDTGSWDGSSCSGLYG
jgi:hypothetical protein